MPLLVPVFVAEKLDQLDRELPPLKQYELNSMFAGAQNAEGLTAEERKGAFGEAVVFSLLPRFVDETSVWGTYFGPMSRVPQTDGSERHFPDIAGLDAEIIDHWQERSKRASHPVLRARYADAVWDLSARAIETRPPVEYAHIATDAYLDAIETQKHGDPLEAILCAKRAPQIALAINDRTRIDRAKALLLELLSNSAQSPRLIGLWSTCFDALYDPGNKRLALTNQEEARMAAILEDVLGRCSDQSGPDFSPWGSQAAAQRLAKYHQKAQRSEQMREVIRKAGQAFESMASNADPLVAMAWLQPIIDDYHNRGMTEDVARAALLSQQKGANARDSVRTIKVSTDVDPKEIERFIERLTEGSLDQVLRQITAQFMPRLQEVRDLMRKMREVAPISSLMPVVHVQDARLVASAGSVEQDPEGRLIMQLAHNLGITAQFLTITLERARERHSLDAEKIASFLLQSPVYDPSRHSTIVEALQGYFSGDLAKFVHLAVPQIEQALRTLLGLMGHPTSKPTRQGTMDVKSLNDLLRDDAIKGCFEEDTQMYLLTFLADRRGVNLRNDLCHGLWPVDRITPALASQVLHVLMTLSLVRENKPPDEAPNS